MSELPANTLPPSLPDDTGRAYRQTAIWVIGALTLIRIAGLFLSPLNLGPDEAQYWRWGQALDWGYYSKPPLIAWLIGATTTLFGHAEWAVRLPAPLLHALTAGLLYRLASDMYDARTGAVCAIGYALMPAVALSSGVMTTDGLLLPLVALALYALWRMRARPKSLPFAALFGVAVGLGFLAKYAMIYVLLGAALACLIDPPTRRALFSPHGAFAALLALGIITPHILWNASNDFQTFEHTTHNADWSGTLFHPENGWKFLVDQMGIAGPIGFVVLCVACIGVLRGGLAPTRARANWLLCFILPVLLLILVQAIVSRAHANWAAAAYPAGSVLIARFYTHNTPWPTRGWQIAAGLIFTGALFTPDQALASRIGIAILLASGTLLIGHWSGWRRIGLFWASLTLNTAVAVIFMSLAVGPVAWSEQLGLANAFKRTRGWQASMAALTDTVRTHGATAIMVDERENWHGLDYYGRDGALGVPVYTWQRNPVPRSHAEAFALPAGASGPVLIASKSDSRAAFLRADFEHFTSLDPIEIQLGGGETRLFHLFLGSGHTPQPRDAAWTARLNHSD